MCESMDEQKLRSIIVIKKSVFGSIVILVGSSIERIFIYNHVLDLLKSTCKQLLRRNVSIHNIYTSSFFFYQILADRFSH